MFICKLMVYFRKYLSKHTPDISLFGRYHTVVFQTGTSSVPARSMSGLPEQSAHTFRYNLQINEKIYIHWREEGAKSPL